MRSHLTLLGIAVAILLVPPLAGMALAADLGWITEALDHIGPLKCVLGVALAGSLGTAAGLLGIFVLDLPIVRDALGGFMWTLGKASSLMCIRWFGKYGQKIEDKLQRFLQFMLDRFFAGCDQDDRRSG